MQDREVFSSWFPDLPVTGKIKKKRFQTLFFLAGEEMSLVFRVSHFVVPILSLSSYFFPFLVVLNERACFQAFYLKLACII